MAMRMLLRLLPAEASHEACWRIDSATAAVGPIRFGSLREAASEVAGLRLVVIVSGFDVVFTRASLPACNRQRMLRALPYALEEQLADDVEKLHFAIAARPAGSEIEVAVVGHQPMQEWLQRLSTAGLQPQAMVVDSGLLHPAADEWLLLRDENEAILAMAEGAGQGLEPGLANELVAMMLESAGEARPQRLRVFDCRDEAGELPQWDGPLEVERRPGGFAQQLLNAVDERAAINLLQGPYDRHEQIGKLLRPWRPVAALLAVWLLLGVGISVTETVRLERERERVSDRIGTLFAEALPQQRTITNPHTQRIQMERALAGLQGGAVASDDELARVLGHVGQSIQSVSGISLRALRYRPGETDIEVEAASLERLDPLRNRLDEGGWTIELQSATSSEGGVESRLVLRGGGA